MIVHSFTFFGATFTDIQSLLRQTLITGTDFVDITFKDNKLSVDDSLKIFPINNYEISVSGKPISGKFKWDSSNIAIFDSLIPDGTHKIRLLPQVGWYEKDGVIYNENGVGVKFDNDRAQMFNVQSAIGINHNWTTEDSNHLIVADEFNFMVHCKYQTSHLIYSFFNDEALMVTSYTGSTSGMRLNGNQIFINTVTGITSDNANRRGLSEIDQGFALNTVSHNKPIHVGPVSVTGLIHPFEVSLSRSIPKSDVITISPGKYVYRYGESIFLLLETYTAIDGGAALWVQ